MSDRGTHFVNAVIRELTTLMAVKHRKTTPYNPKCNGMVERCNGIIEGVINKTVEANKTDWNWKLNQAVFAYNTTYKTTTGHSPYFLIFGQDPLFPVEFEIPTPRLAVPERLTLSDSLTHRNFRIEELEEVREDALALSRSSQEKSKKNYDKKARTTTIVEGDLVLVYDSRYANFPGKLHTRWMGPYLVEDVNPNGSLQLMTMDGDSLPARTNLACIKKYYCLD